MSRMTNTYEFGRAGTVCAATGDSLTPGTPIVAALVDAAGEENLRRVDTRAEAWDRGSRPPGIFAFWRTVVPEATRKNTVVLDDNALLDLFHSMESVDPGDADERRASFRYLIAILLVRRRRLIQVSHKPGVLQVRDRGPAEEAGTPIDVAIPNLDGAALAAATEQLSAFIETGT